MLREISRTEEAKSRIMSLRREILKKKAEFIETERKSGWRAGERERGG